MTQTADWRIALLHRAESLAGELHDAGVKRSDLTSAINGMLYSQGPWNVRAARGRELARILPGLWMKGRGGSVPARLRAVSEVVTGLLSEYKTEREVRFLLGWTLRLLRTLESQSDRSPGSHRTHGTRSSRPQGGGPGR